MRGTMPSPRFFHAADVHNEEELWVIGGKIGMKYHDSSTIDATSTST